MYYFYLMIFIVLQKAGKMNGTSDDGENNGARMMWNVLVDVQ
jgi:hypothetical protein